MSLTTDQLEQIRRDAEESAIAQGHPPKVEDPGAIAKIAALMNPARSREPAS